MLSEIFMLSSWNASVLVVHVCFSHHNRGRDLQLEVSDRQSYQLPLAVFSFFWPHFCVLPEESTSLPVPSRAIAPGLQLQLETEIIQEGCRGGHRYGPHASFVKIPDSPGGREEDTEVCIEVLTVAFLYIAAYHASHSTAACCTSKLRQQH